LLQEGTRTPFQ